MPFIFKPERFVPAPIHSGQIEKAYQTEHSPDTVWVVVNDAQHAEDLRIEAARQQLLEQESSWKSQTRRQYNPSPVIKEYLYEPKSLTL